MQRLSASQVEAAGKNTQISDEWIGMLESWLDSMCRGGAVNLVNWIVRAVSTLDQDNSIVLSYF